MKVYHMSQTLKPGDTMRPDHMRCAGLAMPFVQALERSEDCFYAMVFQGKYLYSIFDHSRLSVEWLDYAKWATEGIFEFVRRKRFPDSVSRLKCNYFYDDLEAVKVLFRYDWGGEPEEAERVHIYELELEEDTPQYFDMRIFDEAYEAMEKRQDLSEALRCAERYFAGERTTDPVLELLSDKPVVIIEDMEWLHRELMTQCCQKNDKGEA